MRLSATPFLISLVLIMLLAALACAAPESDGDINADHRINMSDLERLAGRWLDGSCVGPSGCAEDIDNRIGVDMGDVAVMAKRWGIEGDNLVISEFLAINKYSNYVTVQGQQVSSDWIEIYNPGPEGINLGGWYLTNNDANLAKWPLPAVGLGPHWG